jgi:hypothetical protein
MPWGNGLAGAMSMTSAPNSRRGRTRDSALTRLLIPERVLYKVSQGIIGPALGLPMGILLQ